MAEPLTREAVEAALVTLKQRDISLTEVWETIMDPAAFGLMGCPTFTGFVRDFDLVQYAIPRDVRKGLSKLLYDEDNSVRKIAKLLGVSVGTVSTDLDLPKPTRAPSTSKRAPASKPAHGPRLIMLIDELDDLAEAEEALDALTIKVQKMRSELDAQPIDLSE